MYRKALTSAALSTMAFFLAKLPVTSSTLTPAHTHAPLTQAVLPSPGVQIIKENTVGHLVIECNLCHVTRVAPVQLAGGSGHKLQITFRQGLHKDCEYGAKLMQASLTSCSMPTPGSTKLYCKGKLSIKRPMSGGNGGGEGGGEAH